MGQQRQPTEGRDRLLHGNARTRDGVRREVVGTGSEEGAIAWLGEGRLVIFSPAQRSAPPGLAFPQSHNAYTEATEGQEAALRSALPAPLNSMGKR
jgi:hypothetical protein